MDSECCEIGYNCSPCQKPMIAKDTTEKKLSNVLKMIIGSSYKFSDDTILEKLYQHLSKKCKEGDYGKKGDDNLKNWILVVLKQWKSLDKGVKVFSLRVAGIIASTQDGLKWVLKENVLHDLVQLVRNNENDISITLAYTEMLGETVQHLEGSIWFYKSGLLHEVLSSYIEGYSLYISRKAKQLIINFIISLAKISIESCWDVIDTIVAPLKLDKQEAEYPTRQDILSVIQNYFCQDGIYGGYSEMQLANSLENTVLTKECVADYNTGKFVSTLCLLCDLLEAFCHANFSGNDVKRMLKNYRLELWAWETLNIENSNEEVIRCLATLITYLNYVSALKVENSKHADFDIQDTLRCTQYLMQSLIYKHQFIVLHSICAKCQILGNKTLSVKSFLCREDGINYFFQDQIHIIHILPMFMFVNLACIPRTDITEPFTEKLYVISNIHTKRICYQFRDTIRHICGNTGTDNCPAPVQVQDRIDTDKLLRSCIQSVTKIIKYLSKDQVVIIFQCFMYSLKKFIPDDVLVEEEADVEAFLTMEKFDLIKRHINLLIDMLDTLEYIIQNYVISWTDSLESTCTLSLLKIISSIADLPTPLITKLLRLIRLVISNYIPPNLALLVDNFKNSSFEKLGVLLLKKLHDVHWEIRDSTLEILQTISSLSALKFPAFQNLLLESNFPTVVIGMAVCDEESYVRSSAIVCLQKMVQVKKLWEESLADKKLLEKMLECLRTEPEGIVRKEAASLVTAIYNSHDIRDSLMDEIYKQLAISATSDLHWEVKVNTLSFWEAVIDHETANQGMIDGAFPMVTFSRMSRKIVTLTPSEIQKRLKAVLDTLEENGCLQALWTTLNDQCDLEVLRKSVDIVNRLLQLLQRYGVVENTCGRNKSLTSSKSKSRPQVLENKGRELLKKIESSSNENGIVMKGKSSNGKSVPTSDEVIKSIMNSQDIELLSSVYCTERVKKETNEETERTIEFISANDFITRVSAVNLDFIVKIRTDWLLASDELESLLDDILAVDSKTKDDQINAIDCY